MMGDSTGSNLNPGGGGVVLRGDDPNQPGDERPSTSSEVPEVDDDISRSGFRSITGDDSDSTSEQ